MENRPKRARPGEKLLHQAAKAAGQARLTSAQFKAGGERKEVAEVNMQPPLAKVDAVCVAVAQTPAGCSAQASAGPPAADTGGAGTPLTDADAGGGAQAGAEPPAADTGCAGTPLTDADCVAARQTSPNSDAQAVPRPLDAAAGDTLDCMLEELMHEEHEGQTTTCDFLDVLSDIDAQSGFEQESCVLYYLHYL